MNMVVDAGNTLTKVGIFERESLKQRQVFSSMEEVMGFVASYPVDHLMVSSVTRIGEEILNLVHVTGIRFHLTAALPLPIINRYATPHSLGTDRLAAACGAWGLFPGETSLVIDAGTCINYEFLNEKGEYEGGAISPGVAVRFQSMHQLTDRLPLLVATEDFPLTGTTTDQCLQSGVMNGIEEEIKGVVARYRKEHPGVRVILTGGDAHFFEKGMNPPIFVAPDLVLMGLNSILLHNVNP